MNSLATDAEITRPAASSLGETVSGTKADIRQLAGELRALAEAELLPRAQRVFASVSETAKREGRRLVWRSAAHPLSLVAGAALGGVLLGLLLRRNHDH